MSNSADYYERLGVTRDSEPEVIDAAYRALMRKYHPDRNPEPAARARATELTGVYATLRDPARRQEYDRKLDATKADTAQVGQSAAGSAGHRIYDNRPRSRTRTKACPCCGERIPDLAFSCRHCGWREKLVEGGQSAGILRGCILTFAGMTTLGLLALFGGFATVSGDHPNAAHLAESGRDTTVAKPPSRAGKAAHKHSAALKAGERLIDGKCATDSHVAEGPADGDLSSGRTPFSCDVLAVSVDKGSGEVLLVFGSRRGGSAPSIGFDGGLDELNTLTVDRVVIGLNEPATPEEGFCRLFFVGNASRGSLNDLTSVVCGARIVENGRATVPNVTFWVRR
jgi:curved DNA-binding protein CbpA